MNLNQEFQQPLSLLTTTPSPPSAQNQIPSPSSMSMPPPPYPFGLCSQPSSSPGRAQPQSLPPVSLTHVNFNLENQGGRIAKIKKRKGVDDYAVEFPNELIGMTIQKDGKFVRVLICRFCHIAVGARADRIREHLGSRRHKTKRIEAESAGEIPRMDQAILNIKAGMYGIGVARKVKPPASATAIMTSTAELAKTMEEIERQYGHGQSGIGKNIQTSQPQKRPADEGRMLLVNWSDFESNLRKKFFQYWLNGQFTDATVWCQGVQINCHRLILSSGSAYFEKLLCTSTQNPILFLAGINIGPLRNILDFLYRGQCHVTDKELAEFSNTAEQLGIRGLTQYGQDQGSGYNNNYGYGTVSFVDSDESGVASSEGSPSGIGPSAEGNDDELSPIDYAMTQMRNQNQN